jgi:hypothetical protein
MAKRLREAERKIDGLTFRYSCELPGVHLRTITISGETQAALSIALRLGNSLAAKLNGTELKLFAVKP